MKAMRKPSAKPKHMRRPQFSKGGLIKRIGNRHYFDTGGTVLNGPTSTGGPVETVNNNGLTGNIGNALGLNNEFQGQSANIQAGTNTAQLNNAYTGVQGGLTQQQILANQLASQGAQGMGTQSALTGQLEGVINGTGPNAAQTALNQNTGQNVAATTAEMAGQRGAAGNVGLLARQAAQQGAATQQNAVGQAATLQAQQQIAAQGQLANLAATQVGQQAGAVQGVNSSQQNEQNILQGANTANNNANVSMQSNINNVNAQTAAANQNESGNIVNGVTSAAATLGSVVGLAHGGQVPCQGAACRHPEHYAHLASGGALTVTPPSSQSMEVGPWLNSSVSTSGPNIEPSVSLPENGNAPLLGQSIKKTATPEASTPATDPGVAGEGSINAANQMSPAADFGPQLPSAAAATNLGATGPLSSAAPALIAAYKGGNITPGPHGHVAHFLMGGEAHKVPAMVSPGERYLNPREVKEVIEQGKNPLKLGTKIPGKPKVKGDSLKNDTVPKDLEEGGVVLPRHIMNKKNADHAELFVRRAVHMKAPKGGK